MDLIANLKVVIELKNNYKILFDKFIIIFRLSGKTVTMEQILSHTASILSMEPIIEFIKKCHLIESGILTNFTVQE